VIGRVLVALQLVIIAAAVALAVVPLPQALVERYYADWFYPALQARLTPWSNETPVALFDFILAFLVLTVAILLWRIVTRALRQRSIVQFLRGMLVTAAVLAGAYLWFAISWGLNYAREPLEHVIGFDRTRVTSAAVRALAERAVAETNRGYAAGHAVGFPGMHDVPPALVRAFHEVEQRLGRPRPTVPGRPKYTVLAPLFRIDGTDGMHAPFMLETLLNPDLTPPERPAVLAHEWAHLAGYAPEDDASFVGMLAALRADAGARYSAWLTLMFETVRQLPRDERQRLLARLEEGPRRDQQEILARLESRIEFVQRATWATYDRYLKAQGVREGIQSYSRVVQLLVGSGALDW
jgi:hypothetical protein